MTKVTKRVICGLTVLLFAATSFAGFEVIDMEPDYRDTPNSVHVVYESTQVGQWNQILMETGADSTYDLYDYGNPENGFAGEQEYDEYTLYYVAVPNFIDQEPVKYMRVQLTFSTEVWCEEIGLDVVGEKDGNELPGVIVGQSEPGLSYYHYFDVEIHPNPDKETVGIKLYNDDTAGGQTFVDTARLERIEIDTVSVPEPATVSLLALGSMTLLKRRRFSRR